VTAAEIEQAGDICRQVYVHPVVEEYLLDIVRASRADEAIILGVSPRGTLALYRTSQAIAALCGRDYVIPDDVKRLAMAVLAHRLVLSAEARLRGRSAQEVLANMIEKIPVPVEEVWEAEGQG
jgi:MoxR-like ATPase